MKYHKVNIQLRFSDFDMLKHVNNARFVTFMEIGRVSFFDLLTENKHRWDETGMIVARLELDFKAPVLWGEDLYVETAVSEIGNKSVRIHTRMLAGAGSEKISLRAEAETVMVCYDFVKNQSITVPEAWKQKIEQWNLNH